MQTRTWWFRLLLPLAAGLVVGIALLCWFWGQVASPNPLVQDAKHAEEVQRILNLLPDIPANASRNEVIRFLRLKEPDFEEGDPKGCSMAWDVAPGYRFGLGFAVVKTNGEWQTILTDAGFLATTEPDSPSAQYAPVYPYRTRGGMISK